VNKRTWILGCGIIGVLLVLSVAVCVLAGGLGLVGLVQFAESLPTPRPTPVLTIGEIYWIGALLPPPGLDGLVVRSAELYNKPGNSISDPSVTIVMFLNDATPVKLAGSRGEWCYVEATNEFGQDVEGWLRCNRLLDYEPTPVPTPNRTPEPP
jgi:hypothetical protein